MEETVLDYEKLENYKKIDGNIYTISNKELRKELIKYSKDVLLKIVGNDDVYFEISSNTITYNNCICLIFEEIENAYNCGCTIYTTNNSLLLYGSYLDVITTSFEDGHYILNKDTKLSLIEEIENSDLEKNIKKQIVSKIRNY